MRRAYSQRAGGRPLAFLAPGGDALSDLGAPVAALTASGAGSLDRAEVIRPCRESDVEAICEIVNDAAGAYRGLIPAECWQEPYMPGDELWREIAQGVHFFGFVEAGALAGVMGLQEVREVTLIRHAYVRMSRQGQGIGSALLSSLRAQARAPLLVGTWAEAAWAIRFYQRRGFRLVAPAEADTLLCSYWQLPRGQALASVVLADAGWGATPSAHRGQETARCSPAIRPKPPPACGSVGSSALDPGHTAASSATFPTWGRSPPWPRSWCWSSARS